jgi:exodeoxyribonuclease VII small subunit
MGAFLPEWRMFEEAIMTFEDAFAEMEQIVQRLEAGELTLEEAISLYERGQALVRKCQEHLDQAELRITQLEDSVQENQ